ncbi:phospholipase D family protein [Xanthobacter autotrophicus]|uniref:phospholipase D family protein n=1 Tax=Xanthobacter autotrophicus TaxID=280 RepID=UPI0037281454
MTLLDENQALIEIRGLLAATKEAQLAVAFWGTGAIERLGLDRAGLSAKILCNLDSGACNPTELRRIRALPGVTLKSHPALHAKVYWTPTAAVLGSSNASANGLAMEGDLASGWAEANVRLDDPVVLNDIAAWFERLFAAGHEILDADIKRAEMIWKARTKMTPTGSRLAGDLVTAYLNAPGHPAWKQIKLTYWRDMLKTEDQDWLSNEIAEKRLASTISAYGQWNDRIAANDWVLDFDLTGKAPRFGGIWKALPEGAGPADLRLVYKTRHLLFAGFGRLTFSKADADPFVAITPTVLAAHSADGGRNAAVDFPTAMAIISAAGTVPSEKAFTLAMEQIYTDAIAFGYRPTAFRRMLAEHGGIETARRLIRGTATSGFETLWENQRLDLSVEALILKSEWQSLFSVEERRIAAKRLRDYGYVHPA